MNHAPTTQRFNEPFGSASGSSRRRGDRVREAAPDSGRADGRDGRVRPLTAGAVGGTLEVAESLGVA